MSLIQDATGHNPREERRVANWLYGFIIAGILAAVAFFLLIGPNRTLNPLNLDQPKATDVPATPSSPAHPANPETP